MTRSTPAVAAAVVGLAGMAYCHLSDVGMKFDEHVYYMAVLFCANIAVSIALIPLLLLVTVARPASWAQYVWIGAGALALLTIAGFLWSRTVGFPQMRDHVGEWDAIGVSSLWFEAAVLLTSTWSVWTVRRQHQAV
jgi:hypothetical protein